jgi:hypothetical protein
MFFFYDRLIIILCILSGAELVYIKTIYYIYNTPSSCRCSVDDSCITFNGGFILTRESCFRHYPELMMYNSQSLALLTLDWAHWRWCAFEMTVNTRCCRTPQRCSTGSVCRYVKCPYDRKWTRNSLWTNIVRLMIL